MVPPLVGGGFVVASGRLAGSDSSRTKRSSTSARVSSGRSRYCRSASSSTEPVRRRGHVDLHGAPATVPVGSAQSGEVTYSGAPQQCLLLVREGVGEDARAGMPALDDLVHEGQVKVGV